MIDKKNILLFILLLTLCKQQYVYSQANPDDISVVANEVEDNFYEALKQRGIENYDKAIVAIQKCINKDKTNPVFYHELGKNHLDLKQYAEAENAFKKAIELNPKERWYLNGLYDVFYQTKDFKNSIEIVQKLLPFDENMNEDLVSLYMYTSQHDKALELLNQMESKSVLSKTMEYYRLKIITTNKDLKPEQADLESALKKEPKVEQHYIDLMLFFATSNQEEKAFDVAKKLAVEIPSSDWAHISLFKFYLENNEVENATKSMFRVLENKHIESRIKHRILNEFLILSLKSPDLDKDLDKAISYFEDDKNVNVGKEIGKFFYNKKNYNNTIKYLLKGLNREPNDVEAILLLLESYIALENYIEIENISEKYIDLYPTVSKLYFYAGLSNNKLQKHKTAIDYLETGLEFVVEDLITESIFYSQLIVSNKAINNKEKEKLYQLKFDALQKKK